MNQYVIRDVKKTARFRSLLGAALAIGCAFSAAAQTQPGKITSPETPTLITPPAGNSAFLLGRAEGTQGYVCLPTATDPSTASWTVNAARPEATLFGAFGNEFQIITHFLSPNTHPKDDAPRPLPFANVTWQSSFDNSKVWAAVLHGNTIVAGTHDSCPNIGSLPCLMLESVGAEAGRTGGTFMTAVTFVQRLNTNGGTAPADGCSVAADAGKQVLVPYTADYYFFRKDQ